MAIDSLPPSFGLLTSLDWSLGVMQTSVGCGDIVPSCIKLCQADEASAIAEKAVYIYELEYH